MDIWQRMQSTLNQGLEVSRDLFDKAKDKALDLGEKGMLTLEIKQLESQLEKLTSALGARVYQELSGITPSVITVDSPEIAELVRRIREIGQKIEEREAQLKKS